MRIAYLLNQYPMPSQTFVRREIAALEHHGVTVLRHAVRASTGALPDPDDRAELDRTRVVLEHPVAMATSVLRTMVGRPRRFGAALRLAFRLGRRSTRGLAIHLVYLAEACVVRKWLADERVDHVHSHFGTNATAVAAMCHALGGPSYSFTVHGPEEFDRPEALKLTEKIDGAAFVVAISDHGRSQLYRWCPHEQWNKIVVVHCGLDAAFLDHATTPVPDVPRLVCIGRLDEQKGQLLLLEATRRVVDAGHEITVVLVGDGTMRDQVERVIERDGLTRHVQVRGWLGNDEVRAEIVAARATILASFAEGLPVAIMESFALGRPVVTTHVAGIPELVDHGRNGWLVTPGSVDDLVAAIIQVLECGTSTLTAMGASGAAAVGSRHRASDEAARLVKGFAAAVETSRGVGPR